MKSFGNNSSLILLLLLISALVQIHGKNVAERKTCFSRRSPCFLKTMRCPAQCPSQKPADPKAKVCYVNCDSPICKAECKNKKPNCNAPEAACLYPKFISGDGIVFYLHGKSNKHFSLVSDLNLQINAMFIGLRPAGRSRDYTWIQAIGLLFGTQTFVLEAKHAATWDNEFDHLKFSYKGKDIAIPEGHLSSWQSPESYLTVERTSVKNSVLVTLP